MLGLGYREVTLTDFTQLSDYTVRSLTINKVSTVSSPLLPLSPALPHLPHLPLTPLPISPSLLSPPSSPSSPSSPPPPSIPLPLPPLPSLLPSQAGSGKDVREVHQFHFTSWPDHGVLQYATAMLAMVRRVQAFHTAESGPMVVHCSAGNHSLPLPSLPSLTLPLPSSLSPPGVGRTGTFIVIYSMLERMKTNKKMVDIYGHVSLLRTQRNYMVQTEVRGHTLQIPLPSPPSLLPPPPPPLSSLPPPPLLPPPSPSPPSPLPPPLGRVNF